MGLGLVVTRPSEVGAGAGGDAAGFTGSLAGAGGALAASVA